MSRWEKKLYNYIRRWAKKKKKKTPKKQAQPSQINWPTSRKVWIVLQKVRYVQGLWAWKECTFLPVGVVMPAAQAILHTRSTVIAIHENTINALTAEPWIDFQFHFIHSFYCHKHKHLCSCPGILMASKNYRITFD